MNGINIRRGTNADTEEIRRVMNYLMLESSPKLKSEIVEEAPILKNHVTSALNLLKHYKLIVEVKKSTKTLYKINGEKK